jgi:hypothetical protein
VDEDPQLPAILRSTEVYLGFDPQPHDGLLATEMKEQLQNNGGI